MNTPDNGFDDELITAYLDGELDSRQHERVERLLRQNTEYRRMVDELRALREELQLLPNFRLGEEFHVSVLRRAESAAEADRRGSENGNSPPSKDSSYATTMENRVAVESRNWRGPVWGLAALAAAILIVFTLLPQEARIGDVAQRSPALQTAASEADGQHGAAGFSDGEQGSLEYRLDSAAESDAQLILPEAEPSSTDRQEAYGIGEALSEDARGGALRESTDDAPVLGDSTSRPSADSAFYKRDVQPGTRRAAPAAEPVGRQRSALRTESPVVPAADDIARRLGENSSAAVVDRSDVQQQLETAATNVLKKVADRLSSSPRGVRTVDIVPSVQETDDVDIVVDVALNDDDQSSNVQLDAALGQLLTNLNQNASGRRFGRATVGGQTEEGESDAFFEVKPVAQLLERKRVMSSSNEHVELVYAEVPDEQIKTTLDDLRQHRYEVSEVALNQMVRGEDLNREQEKEAAELSDRDSSRGLIRRSRQPSQLGVAAGEEAKGLADTRDRPSATDGDTLSRDATSDKAAAAPSGRRSSESEKRRKSSVAATEPASDAGGKLETAYEREQIELNAPRVRLTDVTRGGGTAASPLTRDANLSAGIDAAEGIEQPKAPVQQPGGSTGLAGATGRVALDASQDGATGKRLRRVLFVFRAAAVPNPAESAIRSTESPDAPSAGRPMPDPGTNDD